MREHDFKIISQPYDLTCDRKHLELLKDAWAWFQDYFTYIFCDYFSRSSAHLRGLIMAVRVPPKLFSILFGIPRWSQKHFFRDQLLWKVLPGACQGLGKICWSNLSYFVSLKWSKLDDVWSILHRFARCVSMISRLTSLATENILFWSLLFAVCLVFVWRWLFSRIHSQ